MNTVDDSVRFYFADPHEHVSREHIYFAFGDGRFSYDCVNCGAKCCRGFGYSLTGGEVGAQFKTRPAMRLFLEPVHPASNKGFTVTNCPPSCFFLTDTNLCGVHVESGFHAKPETCRLFPFNIFRRVGDFVVVMPHSSLCPLAVVGPGAVNGHSSHARLFAAMSAGGIGGEVQSVPSPHGDLAALMKLERRIVAESERHIDGPSYRAFASSQLSATSLICEPPARSRDEGVNADASIDRFAWLVTELLGITPASENTHHPSVVRAMVATTPVVRAQILFGSAASARSTDVSLERLPYLLMALHVLVAVAREAGMQAITYQTVMTLFKNYRPLLTLLAHADREMVWKPNAPIAWPFAGDRESEAGYLAVVRSLLPEARRGNGRMLGEILRDNLTGADMPRLVFLKTLALRLAGRIVPAADHVSARRSRRTVKGSVQRWVLGHVNEGLMLTVAEHMSLRQAGRSMPPASEP